MPVRLPLTAVVLCLLFALAATASPGGPVDPGQAIEMRAGRVLPLEGGAEAEAPTEAGAHVVRLTAPLTPRLRSRLAAHGARTLAPLGSEGLLLWLPAGATEALTRLPGVAWTAPYRPELRIDPDLQGVEDDDPRDTIPVTLRLLRGTDLQQATQRLNALGLTVHGLESGSAATPRRLERAARLVVTPTPAQLRRLLDVASAWPETLWIGRRPVYRLLNDASAWSGQSGLDRGGETPVYDNGLHGEGQVVAVLDTGLDADMCYFRDDVLGQPPTNIGFGVGSPDPNQRKVLIVNFLAPGDDPAVASDWDNQDHGTHVAGSVLADNLANGVRDPADGMAPAAKLVVQDGGYAPDNCADLPAIGCPAASLTPFFQQAYDQGARIHSNSYGDRENFTPYNIYSDGSEDADAFMWDNPDFLLVFAAGNNGSGPDTVASPATGKNVLSVGATAHGESSDSIAGFSSRGYTDDGRIKPDLTTPGSGVISADNDGNIGTDNCGTKSSSGTSMACPTAAGFAALVREYFMDGFYPGGSENLADAFVPSAAMLRSMLIVSTTPMRNLAPPPERDQGWGRIMLDDALFFPGDAKRLFVDDAADAFSAPADPARSYSLEVLDGNEPLRVVVSWTDYPSNPAAATHLVNDLDLEVESPSGQIYLGNVFSAGESVPGGSPDRVNNVEAVRIENPEAGTWTVRVAPFAIPQASQGYALTATGRLPVSGVFLERSALSLDDSVGGDGDGVLEPGEWVDLPLTLANSGDTTATSVQVQVESLSPHVEVVRAAAPLNDIASAGQASTVEHLRIRMSTSLPCTEEIALRFRSLAVGFDQTEDSPFGTGTQAVFLSDTMEGVTGWQHVAAESTATSGDWILGDPDGTEFQPEDDVTPAPGVQCLFTASNAGGLGTDDIDGGQVVARSGAYDLTGHPEARVRIHRWFANRDLGEDAGDFFRLEIRESAASPDVLLEEMGTNESAARWTAVSFRVADHVVPGPGVELKVTAADGNATGNLVEAAIDEIEFWEPQCDTHDPAPNPVDSLRVDRSGDDALLSWTRPGLDPDHGEADRYRIYRSANPDGGFNLENELFDSGSAPSWSDDGAALAGDDRYYLIQAANGNGDSEPAP